MYQEKARYAGHLLREGDSPVAHFSAVDGVHDRFGNRIFTSPDLVYSVKNIFETRAALLVAPEGQQFIRENHGILREIESGLMELGPIRGKDGAEVTLGPNRSLQSWKSGLQSNVDVLTVDGQSFVLKTHRGGKPNTISQPFMNEMLQIQAVQTDLGSDLRQLNVSLPRFLFASGQLSLQVFEEGSEPQMEEVEDIAYELAGLMENYVKTQREEDNPLWSKVNSDIVKFYPFETVRIDNFLKKEDGSFVLVDPFVSRV